MDLLHIIQGHLFSVDHHQDVFLLLLKLILFLHPEFALSLRPLLPVPGRRRPFTAPSSRLSLLRQPALLLILPDEVGPCRIYTITRLRGAPPSPLATWLRRRGLVVVLRFLLFVAVQRLERPQGRRGQGACRTRSNSALELLPRRRALSLSTVERQHDLLCLHQGRALHVEPAVDAGLLLLARVQLAALLGHLGAGCRQCEVFRLADGLVERHEL